jgi:uncharacterized protein YcnI
MNKYFASALFALIFAAATLDAHVVVQPSQSAPGAEQVYTLVAMVEGNVASTSVELEVPAGLHVTQVASGEGFTFDVKKDTARIVAITGKKDMQPKQKPPRFTFTAHNPQSGTLQWKAHQTFADGSVRHWVAERGAKTSDGKALDPASITTITAAAGAKPGADAEHHDHK